MKITHTDYKHPKHLRGVMSDGTVLCVSPSVSNYDKLNRKGLPSHSRMGAPM